MTQKIDQKTTKTPAKAPSSKKKVTSRRKKVSSKRSPKKKVPVTAAVVPVSGNWIVAALSETYGYLASTQVLPKDETLYELVLREMASKNYVLLSHVYVCCGATDQKVQNLSSLIEAAEPDTAAASLIRWELANLLPSEGFSTGPVRPNKAGSYVVEPTDDTVVVDATYTDIVKYQGTLSDAMRVGLSVTPVQGGSLRMIVSGESDLVQSLGLPAVIP